MTIFMDYEGLTGESADTNHAGWMNIRSMRWGISRNITSAASTKNDRESSVPTITDLTITRNMDSATPSLVIESCCGKGKTVTIHLTKTGAGSGNDIFMEYILSNALISNYEVAANSHDSERPMEHITISFVDLEVKYTPYDEDGNSLAAIAIGYDTASNTKR